MILSDEEELIRYLNEAPNMEMWYDPKSGNGVCLCPFLRKKYGKNEFECMIHDTKPEMCRNYICDPKEMKQIIRRSFEKNLEEYRKKSMNGKAKLRLKEQAETWTKTMTKN
jgi:Fe-S-cluster containining protein